MNKYLFILVLVGTAMLTSCSADDLTTVLSPEEERALVVEAGKDSDMPIILGSVGNGRAITRSPLESSDFQISDGNLSVYCLAKGIQTGAPNISAIPASDDEIVWNDPNNIANWLVNKPAIVSYYNGTGDSPIPGASGPYSYIQFWKGSAVKERYYPFGNWYSYDFFAYYPRVADANTSYSESGKTCYANIPIDGTKDVIWGKALGGFSSKFMREHPTTVPEFEFKHKLSQLVFYIKPRSGDEGVLSAKGIIVTSLTLKNVYKNLKLVVASKEDDSAGTLSLSDETNGDIQVRRIDDSNPLYPITVANDAGDTEEKFVGYAMVPPSDIIGGKTYEQYKVNIVVRKTKEGGIDIPEVGYYNKTITLDDNFVAGRKYKIVLEIKKK